MRHRNSKDNVVSLNIGVYFKEGHYLFYKYCDYYKIKVVVERRELANMMAENAEVNVCSAKN